MEHIEKNATQIRNLCGSGFAGIGGALLIPAQHKLLLLPDKVVKVKVAVFHGAGTGHTVRLFLSGCVYCRTSVGKSQFLSRRKERFVKTA